MNNYLKRVHMQLNEVQSLPYLYPYPSFPCRDASLSYYLRIRWPYVFYFYRCVGGADLSARLAICLSVN